jgi:hypothetical protein
VDVATRNLLKNAVERSAADPAYFLRFFLPVWFPAEMPAFHLGLLVLMTGKIAWLNQPQYKKHHAFLLEHFDYQPDPADLAAKPLPVFQLSPEGRLLYHPPKKNINQIIPRGFSKTTLLKGVLLYEALTNPRTFAVLISETVGHSETQVSDIKLELEVNKNLILGYGNQVPTRTEAGKWTSGELHLKNGAILLSRGRGGQVRGITQNGRRPNIIGCDDIEDEESVATQTQLDKTKSWMYQSVIPAGQIMHGATGEDWAQDPLRIYNLGTLLGPQCLCHSIASDPEFSTIRFGAKLGDDNQMLWDYKMPLEVYNSMRSRWQRQGQLAGFCREYDSTIRIGDETLFPSQFIYEPVARDSLAQVAIAMDPAISSSKRACHLAIIVAGRRESDGALWLLEEWGGIGVTPTEALNKFFELHRKWACDKAGIEAVQYQAALLPLLREQMAKTQYFFHCLPIRHGSADNKQARIVGTLSPRYSNGYLRHLRPLPSYEGNLADWPGGLIDYADAAAMALGLLGETAMLRGEGEMEPMAAITDEYGLPDRDGVVYGNYKFNRSPLNPLRNGRYG